jgi:hypothetical protein
MTTATTATPGLEVEEVRQQLLTKQHSDLTSQQKHQVFNTQLARNQHQQFSETGFRTL